VFGISGSVWYIPKCLVFPEDVWYIQKCLVFPESVWYFPKVFGISGSVWYFPKVFGISKSIWYFQKCLVFPEVSSNLGKLRKSLGMKKVPENGDHFPRLHVFPKVFGGFPKGVDLCLEVSRGFVFGSKFEDLCLEVSLRVCVWK
jgi:hypothetical protein